jgi:hypothetical protein
VKSSVILLLCLIVCACGGYKQAGDQMTFESCNEGQGCNSIVVQGADVASFESLRGSYAKDNHAVYCFGRAISGALPASFEVLSETYAKDNEHAYFKCKQIPSADASSFVADSNLNYAHDKRDVYILGDPINVCDAASFRLVVDQWAVDSQCAYRLGEKLPGAHPRSFSVLNFWYAKDDTQVYATDVPVIPGADVATFALANQPCDVCARDKNRCYKFGSVTSCDTFKR